MSRIALLTGASSGIGAAIAQALHEEGWRIIAPGRRPPSVPATHIPVDLATVSEAELASLLGDVRPDAFIHAAGLLRVAPLGQMERGIGQELWRLHVDVATMIANIVVPRMQAGGRVLLIGSRTANGAAGRSQYAASKAALNGLVRSWAAELAERNITANIIAPGATATPMLDDPARQGVPPRQPPIGRFIRPEEIAALARFLLSPHAGAITGQQIVVCGGASL